MSKIVSYLFALALVSACLILGITSSASATSVSDVDCVPSEPWTETIEHDAVTHEESVIVVDKEAWEETIPATPAVWANFSPNRGQGPFDGPPAYPTDERGTWHIHDQIPEGHAGEDGVYQRDNPGQGNGDWFYRHNATEVQVIQHPAETHPETVIVTDSEARTETIHHEGIKCTPEIPCRTKVCPPVYDSGIIVTHDRVTDYDCGDNFQTVTKITTRVAWDSFNGHKHYDVPTITTVKTKQPHKVVPCNNDNVKPTGVLPNTGGPNWFLIILASALLIGGIRLVRTA